MRAAVTVLCLLSLPWAAAGAAEPSADVGAAAEDATRLPEGVLSYSSAPAAEAPAVGPLFLKALAGLFVVLACLAGVLWVMKRTVTGRAGAAKGHLAVLETRAVHPKCALSVVRFDGRLLLLGHAGERVTLLATGSAESTRAAAAGATPATAEAILEEAS